MWIFTLARRFRQPTGFTRRFLHESESICGNYFMYTYLRHFCRFTVVVVQVVKRAGRNARFSRPTDELPPARFTNAAGFGGVW